MRSARPAPLRHAALLALAGIALPVRSSPAPPPAPGLPQDYREEIVRSELGKNPKFRDLLISYSDPVRVRVHEPKAPAGGEDMIAVVYSYTPHSAEGALYFMIVEGAALFERGAYLGSRSPESPGIEWLDGRPQPHADSPEGRRNEIEQRFGEALRLGDASAGPPEDRQIRREVWSHYEPAIEEMRVPSRTRARLIELLVAREEAPLLAELAGLRAGVDPFSAAMGKAVAEAKRRAGQNLRNFFGASATDRLEGLRRAIGEEPSIRRNEGLDLEAAGIPLSPTQLLAMGKIYADVRDYRRNPAYARQSRRRDAATGLSGLDRAILDRTAAVLAPAQQEVVRNYLIDRARYARLPGLLPAGRSSGWFLHQPADAPLFRRQIRRWVLQDYYAAVMSIGFTPKRAAELIELLVQRNIAPREAAYRSEEKGLDRGSERLAVKAATDEADGRIHAFLGKPDTTRLEELKFYLKIKPIVEEGEAVELARAGCPLTDPQIEAVARAFWEVHTIRNPAYRILRSKPPDPRTGLNPLDAAYLERTAMILSPRQQEVVRTYRMDTAAVLERIAARNPNF